MSRIIISISDLLMLLQGLLLFILRMTAMLLMPSEGLTIYHLVMTGAGSPWSGQGYVLIISGYRVTLFSLFLSSLLHSNWNFAVAIYIYFLKWLKFRHS